MRKPTPENVRQYRIHRECSLQQAQLDLEGQWVISMLGYLGDEIGEERAQAVRALIRRVYNDEHLS